MHGRTKFSCNLQKLIQNWISKAKQKQNFLTILPPKIERNYRKHWMKYYRETGAYSNVSNFYPLSEMQWEQSRLMINSSNNNNNNTNKNFHFWNYAICSLANQWNTRTRGPTTIDQICTFKGETNDVWHLYTHFRAFVLVCVFLNGERKNGMSEWMFIQMVLSG